MSAIENPLTQNIDNWKSVDLRQLVGHFHQLTVEKNSSYFRRLDQVFLDDNGLKDVFRTGKTITSFEINMALTSSDSLPDKITFSPVLKVNFSDQTNGWAEFKHEHEPSRHKVQPIRLDARVPYNFKEALSKNWMELENGLIDDVFMRSVPHDNNPSVRKVERIERYCYHKGNVNQHLLDFAIHYGNSIKKFIFYLGVDMNKFYNPNEFSFSPVIGVVIQPAVILPAHKAMLRVIEGEEGDKTFFEYSAPCPSTC